MRIALEMRNRPASLGSWIRKALAASLACWLPMVVLGQEEGGPLVPRPFDPLPREMMAASQGGSLLHPQQARPEVPAPLRVDPKLVGRKVILQLRDGREYKGELTEVTQEFLSIRAAGWDPREGKPVYRSEKIPLTELLSVRRQRSRARLAFIIVGVAAGVALALYAVAQVAGEPD